MNNNLLFIVRRIITDNGEAILADPARLKAFFSDLAKDEPKPLRIAFGRCVESGAYNALKTAPDAAERISRKAAIAQRVRDEHGLDTALCGEALDILEAALYGTTSAAQNTPPRYAPESPPPQTPGYQGPPAYTAPPTPPPVYADLATTSIQPNPPLREQQSPGRKVRHKFTTFWLVYCLISFGVFLVVVLISYNDPDIFDKKGMYAAAVLYCGLATVGYFLLLMWKKAGFWVNFLAGFGSGVVLVVSVVVDNIDDTDVLGFVLVVIFVVLMGLFHIGPLYGILRLRGSNGKSAWEQLE